MVGPPAEVEISVSVDDPARGRRRQRRSSSRAPWRRALPGKATLRRLLSGLGMGVLAIAASPIWYMVATAKEYVLD